jgi:hypothetical protein
VPTRALSLFLALAVSACTVTADQPVTTATAPVETTATAPTSTSEQTTTTPVAPTLPPGTEDLPVELREEIGRLIVLTEQLREMEFLRPPTIVVVTAEELEARVRESIEEDIEDLPADEALFRLLGLIEPETDLLQLYLDLYGEQVAGYYDGDTGELVVPVGESFSELQKATLVHELVHALTDQRFGFNDTYRRLIDEHRFDEAVALLAVVEGDATWTEILYIQQLGLGAQQELLQDYYTVDSSVFESVPAFVQDSLVFPYVEGMAFVQRAHEIGGFDEVNRLYVEPPVSSEQIIDPRAYQRDMPIPVQIVEPAISGYDVVYRSTWGELGFSLMFDQVLGGAPDAADGWGGDAYLQWFDGGNAALLIEFVGDTPQDAEEMRDALVDFVSVAMAVDDSEQSDGGVVFTGDDFAYVALIDGRVFFVAAHDPQVGRQIVAARR